MQKATNYFFFWLFVCCVLMYLELVPGVRVHELQRDIVLCVRRVPAVARHVRVALPVAVRSVRVRARRRRMRHARRRHDACNSSAESGPVHY